MSLHALHFKLSTSICLSVSISMTDWQQTQWNLIVCTCKSLQAMFDANLFCQSCQLLKCISKWMLDCNHHDCKNACNCNKFATHACSNQQSKLLQCCCIVDLLVDKMWNDNCDKHCCKQFQNDWCCSHVVWVCVLFLVQQSHVSSIDAVVNSQHISQSTRAS